jgi:chromosome segregation ATPase
MRITSFSQPADGMGLGRRGLLRIACVAMAGLLVILPGCQSDRDQHSSDEWAELEKDRDNLKSKYESLRKETEDDRAVAKETRDTAIALAQDEAERFGRQLDAIRDAVAKAMTESGHEAAIAAGDRTQVDKLVGEFVRTYNTLRKRNGDLQLKCDALSSTVAGLSGAPASQPDSSSQPHTAP